MVLSDGVFPVSGEIAPLPDYLDLVKPRKGLVYLDDAHAVGVLARTGVERRIIMVSKTGAAIPRRPWPRRWAASEA